MNMNTKIELLTISECDLIADAANRINVSFERLTDCMKSDELKKVAADEYEKQMIDDARTSND